MSVGERSRGQPHRPGAHVLLTPTESRDAVAAFLEEGLLAGEYVVAVLRAATRAGVLRRLEERDVPVDRLLADGHLILEDAVDMLRRLSAGGAPNQAAFEQILMPAVRELAARGRMRACGEMVDILAQRGDLDDALSLEWMWNRLCEIVPMSLLCGYSTGHFVDASAHRSLRAVRGAHTRSSALREPLADALTGVLDLIDGASSRRIRPNQGAFVPSQVP